MEKRLTKRAKAMIERALNYFPELRDATITIGYTRKHLGSASVVYQRRVIAQLVIRLKVRALTYQTIGHELTHLIQGMNAGVLENIPSGEKQCDIWTLARDRLFCDDAPTYLRMPRFVREHWSEFAEGTRQLCIAAIEKRKTHRFYIRWLETEIKKLGGRSRARNREPQQLLLPLTF